MRRLYFLAMVIGACLGVARGLPVAGDGSSYIHEIEFSSNRSGPSVIQADRDGTVWVALARVAKVARIARDGAIREFSLPAGSFPVGIARDKAGHLYISDIRRNVIVQLDTATGAVRDFSIPTQNAWPFFVSMSSDGRVWFTERVGNKIGSFDPVSGVVKEYPVPSEQAQPAGLTVTPDDVVYFTENTGHKLGRLDPRKGQITEMDVPSILKDSPYYGLAGITSDARGSVWFTELDGRICQVKRRAGMPDTIIEIPLPDPAVRPAGIVVDRWGIVWFTELDGNAIGSYNPSLKVFDSFAVPTGAPDPSPMGPPEATARGEIPMVGFRARTSRPFGITVDTAGSIWFSEQYAHKVGRLDVPELRLFEPQARATRSSANVVLQVRSGAPAPVLHFELNGATIPAGQKIDLTFAPAGKNEFRVSLAHKGGTSEVSGVFTYDPDLAAIEQALLRQPSSVAANPVVSAALAHTREAIEAEKSGRSEAARHIEHSLIEMLRAAHGKPAALETVLNQLVWKDRFGSHQHVVRLDGNTFLPQRGTLVIEAGDTVQWVATGANATTTLAVRPCDEESEALPHAVLAPAHLLFYKPGSFTYAAGDSSSCSGHISVEARSLAIQEFPLPDENSVPGVLAVDSSGNVWFTEGGGGYSKLAAVPLNNKIGCLRTDGTLRQYPTPTQESAPTSIHVGAEGHIWFTERAGNNIGELMPETGQIIEHPIPTPNSGTTGITVDHKGLIWFASKGSSKIGWFNPVTGEIAEVNTPTPASQPSTITVDADNNIWFDERAQDKIVRYEAGAKKMTEFKVPTRGSRVVGLVPDRDGNIFFLELGANKVGHLQVATGQIVEYAIPTNFSSPFKEALDNEGRLWFTEVFGNKIGMLENGRFTEYRIPTAESMPGGITIDMLGNIWFSEQAGNKIARIPAMVIAEHTAVYGGPGHDHAHHGGN
jgi:streptogramin lyase